MKYYLLFLLSLLFSFTAFCQEQKLSVANFKHENMAYLESVEIYKKLLKKGFRTAEIYQNIGDSYYFNGDYKSATSYYKSLFGLKKQAVPAEYYFRYVQSLKAQNKYDLADKFLNKIPEEIKSDSRFKLYFENQNYLEDIKSIPKQFKVDTTSINSAYSDYGAFILNDKFYFTSSRDTSGFIKRTHSWTNQGFAEIYQADVSTDGMPLNPAPLKTDFSKKLNQSSAIFTKDGKTMFFTQNNSEEGKRVKNQNKKTLLKIFIATFDGKKWRDAIVLPFNSDDFSCAHPALSVDEKHLYFSSDMLGTLGASDIFRVEILENGTYGTPENLGSKINTEGRETFPFISADNQLYFASDGRAGLGGLDIYKTDLNSKFEDIRVENLGSEINSNADDFAFFINSETAKGFFSSNRSKGLGFDDIYKFTKVKKCEKKYEGSIVDSENKTLLAGVKVTLQNQKGEHLQSILTSEDGKFAFTIDCEQNYLLSISKELYNSEEQIVSTTSTSTEIILEKSQKPIKVGDDLAKILSIKSIYFDLDKYNIRPDAEYELTKILLILEQEPKMEISIRSHTDSRASKEYNLELSTNRAKSTMNWLIKKGISSKRLKSAGFGESQLLNNCSDGIECSEEEHQLNRRSEFIIIKI
ncbi:MAG: OmpA family protein [Flavobacterium sp.]